MNSTKQFIQIFQKDPKIGKIKKKNRTLDAYLLTHDNSQRQVKLTSRRKAQKEYSKSIETIE